jgi:hypothetical protein
MPRYSDRRHLNIQSYSITSFFAGGGDDGADDLTDLSALYLVLATGKSSRLALVMRIRRTVKTCHKSVPKLLAINKVKLYFVTVAC